MKKQLQGVLVVDEEDRENCGYDEMMRAHPNGRGGGSSAEQHDEVRLPKWDVRGQEARVTKKAGQQVEHQRKEAQLIQSLGENHDDKKCG